MPDWKDSLQRELRRAQEELQFTADPRVRWITSLVMLLVFWVFLLYADAFGSRSSGEQTAAESELAPIPGINITPVPAPALHPQQGDLLWVRFPSDCWLQMIVGDEVVVDRFYQGGDRLQHQGKLPDILVVGSDSAEVWLMGKRLDPDHGERRDTAVRYPIRDLALRTGRSSS